MKEKEQEHWLPLNGNFGTIVETSESPWPLLLGNDLEMMGIAQDVRINVERITDLCFRGGIGHLHLRSSNEGFEKNESSVIVGHDEHGNAFGGFASGKSITQRALKVDLFPDVPKDFAKSCVNLDFNLDLIREEVMRSKGGLRSSAEWAKVMDREIKKGLGKVAIPFLLKPARGDIFVSAAVFSILSALPAHNSLMFNLAFTLGMQNGENIYRYYSTRKSGLPARNRTGNIIGMEFVNAASWYYLAKTRKLVDTILEEDSNISF